MRTPFGVRGCAVRRGDASDIRDIGEERVGMRAFDARSVALPDTGRPAAAHDAKVTPGTYNPDGAERVQLAWQRFSTSKQRPAVRLYGRSARRSDPACPVRPAACR
ncbi:hypothetical protein GCM10022403_038400 [Streptomyces coacervatus]|uniref:Uncharacterized protein n=1 Tax=Streptomyces coacervatus TaxID=647381 RepID=A0ABP7HSA2_9ACTN